MSRFTKCLAPLLVIVSGVLSAPAHAASDFPSIIRAVNQVLASKTFVSDDGTEMRFGPLRHHGLSGRADLEVVVTLPDGKASVYIERYIDGESQVTVDQIVNRRVQSSFLATFEYPYEVLRIRPLDSGNPNFISRECFYDKKLNRNRCYFKLRENGSVFFHIFTETKH